MSTTYNPGISHSCFGIPILSQHTVTTTIHAVRVVITGATKTFLNRHFLEFDVSDIADSADIVSAKLIATASSILAAESATVRRLTNNSATPFAADSDWIHYDHAGSLSWATVGGDYTNTNELAWTTPVGTGTFEIPGMKDLVVDAVDDGVGNAGTLSLIIRIDDETDSGVSRGLLTDDDWQLVVTMVGGGLPGLIRNVSIS